MKKMMTGLAAAGLMVAAIAAQAADPFVPALNLGVSMTEGNSETLAANLGVLTGTGEADDANRTRLGAEWNYGETGDENTVQNAQGKAVYERALSDVTYGYGSVGIFHDDIADIQYRVPVSVGLGYVAWQDEAAKLILEAGPAYVFEKVADESNDYLALRAAEGYVRDLSKTSRLWQTLEYLPEVEDFGNYLLNFEIGAEADMNSKAALRVVFKDRYDSDPAEGTDENDLQLLAGLSYKL